MPRLLVTLFACLLPLVVFAQEPRRATIELAGTFATPTAPDAFSEYWNDGFGVSGGINFPLSPTARLSFLVDVARFSLDERAFLWDFDLPNSGIAVDGGDATLIYGITNLSVLLGDPDAQRMIPYVLCGAGVYRQSFSDATVSGFGESVRVPSDSETAVGLNVGVGFEMPAGRSAKFFVDGRYVFGFTGGDATQFVPIRFGIRTQ